MCKSTIKRRKPPKWKVKDTVRLINAVAAFITGLAALLAALAALVK